MCWHLIIGSSWHLRIAVGWRKVVIWSYWTSINWLLLLFVPHEEYMCCFMRRYNCETIRAPLSQIPVVNHQLQTKQNMQRGNAWAIKVQYHNIGSI